MLLRRFCILHPLTTPFPRPLPRPQTSSRVGRRTGSSPPRRRGDAPASTTSHSPTRETIGELQTLVGAASGFYTSTWFPCALRSLIRFSVMQPPPLFPSGPQSTVPVTMPLFCLRSRRTRGEWGGGRQVVAMYDSRAGSGKCKLHTGGLAAYLPPHTTAVGAESRHPFQRQHRGRLSPQVVRRRRDHRQASGDRPFHMLFPLSFFVVPDCRLKCQIHVLRNPLLYATLCTCTCLCIFRPNPYQLLHQGAAKAHRRNLRDNLSQSITPPEIKSS